MAITLTKPTVNGSDGTWGTTLNNTLDAVANYLDGDSEITPDLTEGSWKIGGTTITSTAADVNKLASVNASAAELNIVDGSTSATSTTLVDADRVVVNDNGTMVQVAMSDVDTYITTDAGLVGTTRVEEVVEKVSARTSTSGTINFDCKTQAIENYTANQTANRTINFRGNSSTSLNSMLSNNESITVALVMKQGSSPKYLSAYQIDGTAVTPKWANDNTPDAGNASSLDVYSFTIIKTASSTFTVLASLTQYK